MFSRSRNIRKLAKSVTLAAASSVIVTAGVQAADMAGSPLVLTAYSNGAGGQSLIEGNYEEAMKQIELDRATSSTAYSAKTNNLCVALAVSKKIEEAKAACTSALKAAKYDKLNTQRYAPGSSRENAYVAIAYTNRAVVHMMAKDTASANEDLARAKSLAPTAEFVSRNLAAAKGARSTIAQLEVSSAR